MAALLAGFGWGASMASAQPARTFTTTGSMLAPRFGPDLAWPGDLLRPVLSSRDTKFCAAFDDVPDADSQGRAAGGFSCCQKPV